MATFILDGERVMVRSAEELVHLMHMGSRTQAVDDVAYMQDVADRTVLQADRKLRTNSAAAFVNDLVANGLLEVVLFPDANKKEK